MGLWLKCQNQRRGYFAYCWFNAQLLIEKHLLYSMTYTTTYHRILNFHLLTWADHAQHQHYGKAETQYQETTCKIEWYQSIISVSIVYFIENLNGIHWYEYVNLPPNLRKLDHRIITIVFIRTNYDSHNHLNILDKFLYPSDMFLLHPFTR